MEVFKRLPILLKPQAAPAGLVVILSTFLASCLPVSAQYSSKMDDPNYKHFYMGRQEIEVLDNSPIVKYRRSAGAGGGQTGGVQGPVPLPAAGFQQYSNNVPSGPSNLPKVENGVPHKLPLAAKGNPGKLKAKASTQTSARLLGRSSLPSTAAKPTVAKYKKSYQTRPESASSGAASLNSAQKVRGKLLPWATNKHQNY
jgi:hypothetical protein